MSTPATIHTEIAAAWNKRDYNAMRSLVHRDYSYTGGDGKEIAGGPDVALGVAQMFASAFTDGVLTVKRVYVQGDTAIAEMVGTGTHNGEFMGIAPTGRQVAITICNVIEMRDGKAYREREYMDMLAMMSQIGVLSLPARAKSA